MKISIVIPSLLAVLAHAANAATFTVTTDADNGTGSLRDALRLATAYDYIQFNIRTSCQNPPCPVRIQPRSPLPDITVPIIIDGFTQPGTLPNSLGSGDNAKLMIELDGSLIPGAADGLRVVNQGDGTTIQGLAISGFKGAGILLASSYNTVQGCFLGTGIFGTSARPNTNGIVVENGGFNQIGGPDPVSRNVISGNRMAGIAIKGPDAEANQVQGNYIGTDVSGKLALRNEGPGILIGPQGNSGPGGHNTMVGGLHPAEANLIRFNAGSGVTVWDANPDLSLGAQRTDQNQILGNSIFDNEDLSIDLTRTFDGVKGDGLTVNDSSDDDIGPNQFQNYPLLPAACPSNEVAVELHCTLKSKPGQYHIELFANSTCALGVGQGEQFVKSLDVTTDSTGTADFDLLVPPTLGKGNYSLTATDSSGNTSEFAPCGIAAGCCSNNCFIAASPVLSLRSAAVPSAALSSGTGPLAAGPSGTGLICSWSGERFALQTAANPAGPWSSVTLGTMVGMVGTNSVPQFETYVPIVAPKQFFRLVDLPVCPGAAVNH